MPTFTVYSRSGCHLCEILIEELLPHLRGRAELTVVDIDADPILRERYDILVPVLMFEEREVCRYRLDLEAVQRTLTETGESA